jgi:outer membrane protein TolC
MLKNIFRTAALTALSAALLCVPAFADGGEGLAFDGLADTIRENDLNFLAIEENIAAIEAVDYDVMAEDMLDGLNEMSELKWMLIQMPVKDSYAISSLDQSYDALKESYDDLKEGKLQQTNADLVRQLRSAQDQLVMAGESMYIALSDLGLTESGLERNLAQMDRSVEEMNLRYELGQISELTLRQVEAQRSTLDSNIKTLQMNISTMAANLGAMTGTELGGTAELMALPSVTDEQLAEMDYEKDLEAAKAASYELYDAKKTLDDAKQDYEDAGKEYHYNTSKYEFVAAQHTWEAAQRTYESKVQSFELSFRALYLQVGDYRQIIDAQQTALELAKANRAAAALQFEQGKISQNELLDAEDAVAAAEDSLAGAKIDLFSAWNNYRWAVDSGILN